MSSDSSLPSFSPPSLPSAESLQPQRSSWPTVFGILLIVFCSLQMIGALIQISTPLWAEKVFSSMQQSSASQPGVAWSAGNTIQALVLGMIGVFLAVFGIISGVKLNKRNSVAIRFARWWSVLDLFMVLVSNVIGFMNMPELPPVRTQSEEVGRRIGMVVGGACGVIIGLALPVVLLIWLNRSKIKSEIALWT